MFVKTGDTVKIIAGKYKGETGEVTKVFPKENKVTYICSTIIHMGLSIFILHSFVLPIMMLVILVVRIYNCNLFEKILLCQK